MDNNEKTFLGLLLALGWIGYVIYNNRNHDKEIMALRNKLAIQDAMIRGLVLEGSGQAPSSTAAASTSATGSSTPAYSNFAVDTDTDGTSYGPPPGSIYAFDDSQQATISPPPIVVYPYGQGNFLVQSRN